MMRAGACLAGAIIAALGTPWGPVARPLLAATDSLEDLTSRWYAIEAIVFERPGIAEANSVEELLRVAPRNFPTGIRSVGNIAKPDGYRLSPLTLATLEFPILSLQCPGTDQAAPYRPASVSAWYQPAAPGSTARTVDSSTAAAPATPPSSRCAPAPPVAPEAQDPVAAAGEPCPPAPFDIPLAPGQRLPICAELPGKPPPTLAPVLEPHPLLEWLSTARRFESALRQDSYQASTEGARLRRQANRIRNAEGLRLLWHGRWTQPVPARSAPQPLLVQAGWRQAGIHELEGAFSITLGRYLHFHARLWLHSAQPDGPPAREAPSTVSEASPTGPEREPPMTDPMPYMVLEESRTMRSSTLHYLDHPKLGVLVQADPVEPPDWLVDASAAFQAYDLGD